ncbi:MAG: putative Histidine kinase [Holophagaceae bacterium]|nr:putative Histidine kinase [Holophagaceae bacterium]
MSRRVISWIKSLHAKLFLLTALVTSVVTILVAASITNNSRKEMLLYTKRMAIQNGLAVESEIQQRWDLDFHDFKDPEALGEFLQTLSGEDRIIFQIDVFKRVADKKVALVASSVAEESVDSGAQLGSYLTLQAPQPELVDLNTGNKAWKVYLPIRPPKGRKGNLGIIRVYCDLEHWESIWAKNLRRTYTILPFILMGEFILLWVVLGTVVSDPVRAITSAMARLQEGDPEAKAEIRRADELGQIAQSFNTMAVELRRATREKEFLIEEVRGLNTHLQDRIDSALAELQAKNQELEQLVERNAVLREELGQQERLAVAGQLTTAFAHEVGTPLNLVNAHLQLLHSQTDLGDRTRERLNLIQAQIERVGDIVRRMLGLVRRPQLQPEPVALESLLAELHRLWLPTFTARHIAFETEVPAECTLLADHKQMEQLFINLVNNAMDAMPQGGSIIARALAPNEGNRWQVILEDTGSGIPEELLPMVFRPMFTTKPEGKGTGLGLSICREIIRAHGGEISIEAPESGGTRICFSLPGMPKLSPKGL